MPAPQLATFMLTSEGQHLLPGGALADWLGNAGVRCGKWFGRVDDEVGPRRCTGCLDHEHNGVRIQEGLWLRNYSFILR